VNQKLDSYMVIFGLLTITDLERPTSAHPLPGAIGSTNNKQGIRKNPPDCSFTLCFTCVKGNEQGII